MVSNNQQLKNGSYSTSYGSKKIFKKAKRRNNIQINIPTTHAVLFPATPKPEMLKKEFRFDIKPEMMMWKEQFQDLDESIDKIFSLQKSKNFINPLDLKFILYLWVKI